MSVWHDSSHPVVLLATSVNGRHSRRVIQIAKIENSYAGGDFVIVAGDASVLSVFAAAACAGGKWLPLIATDCH